MKVGHSGNGPSFVYQHITSISAIHESREYREVEVERSFLWWKWKSIEGKRFVVWTFRIDFIGGDYVNVTNEDKEVIENSRKLAIETLELV